MPDSAALESRFVWQGTGCRICKKRNVPLSAKGYCEDCGIDKCKRVCHQIKSGKGYYANRRLAGYKRMIKKAAG